MSPIVKIEGSTSIHGIGYDGPTTTMVVHFAGGRIYEYPNVPEEAHAVLMASESKGKHFATHIRNKFTGSARST